MTTKAEYEREMAELAAAYDVIHAEFPTLVTRRFECRVGWYPLIRNFFAEVAEALKADPKREFVLLQVKEKFGGLRVYYRLLPFENDAVANRIHDAYMTGEKASMKTCDVCGKPGATRNNRGCYITRCDDHADGASPIPGGGNVYSD
jgi:hypothetical protein